MGAYLHLWRLPNMPPGQLDINSSETNLPEPASFLLGSSQHPDKHGHSLAWILLGLSLFLKRDFSLYSLNWPRTHFAAQAGHKLTATLT